MKQIVKVIPEEETFTITWMLGRRCNYDCMYCPAEYHDKTSPHRTLEELKIAWNNIHDKARYKKLSYKICFTGGEVTANKHFLPFIQWLNKNFSIHSIVVTSNGSAGINYYEKLSKEITNLSFSTHTEFIKEKSFFEKCLLLNKIMKRPKKIFHLNIMNEYWAQQRISLYEEFCKKNRISYSINKIWYHHATRKDLKNEGKLDYFS